MQAVKETEELKGGDDERDDALGAYHDALLDLGDYVTDLKAKNDAFAATMSDRTASTQGQEKGAVAAARADLEEKFQLFRRMLNVASTYEGDSDYRSFPLAVNAEVEHYRLILARKGVSTGSSSSNSGSDNC